MVEIDTNSRKNTDKQPKRRYKPHYYATALIVMLGIVANAAAVADLFTKNIGAIGLVAGTLTIIVGMYLLLGSWGKRVGWRTILAVAIIVAGSVTLSLILQKGGYIDTGETVTDKNGKTTPAVVKDEIKDKGKRYTLTASESLDLDDGNETILEQQSTAKSPADLFFNDWAYLDASVKSFYPYQAPRNKTGNAAKDEYNSCRNLIDTSEQGKEIISSSSVEPNKSYCAITTKGTIMLVTVEELIDKGYAARQNSSISFYVKLLKG